MVNSFVMFLFFEIGTPYFVFLRIFVKGKRQMQKSKWDNDLP